MSLPVYRFIGRALGGAIVRRLRARRLRRIRRLAQLRYPIGRHEDVTEIDIAMMQRAIELGKKAAALGEVPVGAVVYRGEQVFAEGYNLRESASDPTAHAELIAVREAGKRRGEWRLTDCSLAVTLEPCPMCAGALVNARLGRLIYGATDPKAGACHTLYRIPTDARLNHRVEVIGGVMATECAKLLTDFFQQRRRAGKELRENRSARSA